MAPSSEELAQFISITQASPEDAARFLDGTNFETAVANFFAAGEVEATEAQEDEPMLPSTTQDEPSAPAATSGPRTLGGAPAAAQEPLPAGWGQPARNMLGRVGQSSTPPDGRSAAGGSGPRIATLGTVGRAGEPDNLYTGGEKSGLAVQNPDGPSANPLPEGGAGGIVGNILNMASEGSRRLADKAKETLSSATPASAFTGSGNTLGSDDTPSTVVPGPSGRLRGGRNANSASILRSLGGEASDEDEDENEENDVKRGLTFWKDGFSVEDGPLHAYDAPGSQAMLEAIHKGFAPPSFFNVRPDQTMQLMISQRTDEMYRQPPPRPVGMFEGQGNRLGAVTPPIAESSRTMPGAMPPSILSGGRGPAKTESKPVIPSEFSIDESQPATRIQVRLGDGTRITARVNLSHTVGDLRNFINASRADSRAYALQTTFPNRDLNDDSETIEQAKLSNAVVVQRWL